MLVFINYELFVSGQHNILLYFIIIYVNVIITVTNYLYVHITNNMFKILHRCTDKKQIFQTIPHRVAQRSANNEEVQFIFVSPNDLRNTP